ncbi:MAG: NUDIX domain-containing protein [Sphingomicrobium sp.]
MGRLDPAGTRLWRQGSRADPGQQRASLHPGAAQRHSGTLGVSAPRSAGVLLYRRRARGIEVLLIRPGGPFWRNRDQGAWMIPKGAIEPGETSIEAARREFAEETGTLLEGELAQLATVRQSGGKTVEAFAAEGDLDEAAVTSVDFETEWPPRSGQVQRFPEVEQARWMTVAEARKMMLPSQLPLIDALEAALA